jgi:hypothetical protein
LHDILHIANIFGNTIIGVGLEVGNMLLPLVLVNGEAILDDDLLLSEFGARVHRK